MRFFNRLNPHKKNRAARTVPEPQLSEDLFSASGSVEPHAVLDQFEERDDAAPIGARILSEQDVQDVPHTDVAPRPTRPESRRQLRFRLGGGPEPAADASPLPLENPGVPRQDDVAQGPVAAAEESAEIAAETAESNGSARALRFMRSMLQRRTRAGQAQLPIRVLIGYLPEVGERDALEYAEGVAAKHFDNLGQTYFDAFKCDAGYAYEVHEGGPGRAYLPEIIRYYQGLGQYSADDVNKVAIRTATRTVEVVRQRAGLSALLLPESQKPQQPSWLVPRVPMRPAVNKRTGLLVAGAVLFVTGCLGAMVSSLVTRLQPWEPAPEPVALQTQWDALPLAQYPLIERFDSSKGYITALRYDKNGWRVDSTPWLTPKQSAPAVAPSASAAATQSEQNIIPPAP